MELKFICPLWGSEHLDFNTFLADLKDAGYNGIEMSLPMDQDKKNAVLKAINQNDLLFIAQHWETATSNFENHKAEYHERLINLAKAQPLFINSQTGKDYFSFVQNCSLFEIADKVAKDFDVKIIHETHRGKFSFAAHITASYLKRLPNLRLGFDLSHWCNVAESYLEDQQEAVELAISRADHIHARVGFPEGPQIPDPRAGEWANALEIHLGWWDSIINRARGEGRNYFTVTSEFGPFPYMQIIPNTRQPISNQWEINLYMMNLLKKRYANK